MLHLVTFSSQSFTLRSPGFVAICKNFGGRCCALQQTTLNDIVITSCRWPSTSSNKGVLDVI